MMALPVTGLPAVTIERNDPFVPDVMVINELQVFRSGACVTLHAILAMPSTTTCAAAMR